MKKTEKIAAWILLIIIILGASYGLSSEEIDDICTTNGMLMKRTNGLWACYNESNIEPPIRHCHSYSRTTQQITNTSQYARINFEINDDCTRISTDGENFTVEETGEYHITADLHADKTAGATATLEAIILLNNQQINGSMSQRTVSSNNEVGWFGINWNIQANAEDNISIGITGTNNLAQINSYGCILCDENTSARITIYKE